MLLSLTVGDWGNICLLTFLLSYLPDVVVIDCWRLGQYFFTYLLTYLTLLSLTVGDWGNICLLTFLLSYLPDVVVIDCWRLGQYLFTYLLAFLLT